MCEVVNENESADQQPGKLNWRQAKIRWPKAIHPPLDR